MQLNAGMTADTAMRRTEIAAGSLGILVAGLKCEMPAFRTQCFHGVDGKWRV
jgi:hypothetical protein